MTANDRQTADELQYHIELRDGDITGPVLLPGDPERVDLIADLWEDVDELAHHREYRTLAGAYQDESIAVTSTGIGSPSAAIAVEELAEIGVDTFLRVGSCGAIQPEIDIGDLVITTGAVRQEGTSDEYVRSDYPAVAHDEVVTALVTAAERLGHDYHLGTTCSTDSFYAGQSRPGFEDYQAAGASERIDALREAGVLNFEMETSAILTLAGLYGLRAGAVCTVFANRVTDEFRVKGQRKAAETASEAAAILTEMDRIKDTAGVDRWHAGLSLEDRT